MAGHEPTAEDLAEYTAAARDTSGRLHLSDPIEEFRLDVRRHLGYPRHLDVDDEDIDAMRTVLARHGIRGGASVAARMLVALWTEGK